MFDLASAEITHISADLAPFLTQCKAWLASAGTAAKAAAVTLAASAHLAGWLPHQSPVVRPVAASSTHASTQDDCRFDAFMKQTMDNEGRGITTITPQASPGTLIFRGVVTSIKRTASGGVLIEGINVMGNATRAILTREDLTQHARRVVTLSGIQPMPQNAAYAARGFSSYAQIATVLGLHDRADSVQQAVDVLKALAWDPTAVRRVYHARYWERDFAQIRSDSLVAVLADSNVHMGTQRTHEYLQRALAAHHVSDLGSMTQEQSGAVLTSFVRERLAFYSDQGSMAQAFTERLQRTLEPYRHDVQARQALAVVAQACHDEQVADEDDGLHAVAMRG